MRPPHTASVRIPTLTARGREDKKAHKPALTRSVRTPSSSSSLSHTFLRSNDPHSVLLKSRARIALLFDLLIQQLKENP